MIAAARRQNYGSVASLGRCRPPCMVDFCVYLFYRAAVSLVAALPLRFVFSLGNVLGFFAWCLLPNYRRLARQNLEPLRATSRREDLVAPTQMQRKAVEDGPLVVDTQDPGKRGGVHRVRPPRGR